MKPARSRQQAEFCGIPFLLGLNGLQQLVFFFCQIAE
jgi:hypothetical protein